MWQYWWLNEGNSITDYRLCNQGRLQSKRGGGRIAIKISFHEFHYIHCTGQFMSKMKANAKPCLLSSLVWIDSGVVVSQHCLESFFMKWNVTEWQVSWNSCKSQDVNYQKPHQDVLKTSPKKYIYFIFTLLPELSEYQRKTF